MSAPDRPIPTGGPWTRHGHPIPGVTVAGGRPPAVARCGGPALCRQCREDVAQAGDGLLVTPDRPTREQVDTTLRFAEDGMGDTHNARLLAAEVRALRAELDQLGIGLDVETRRADDWQRVANGMADDAARAALVARTPQPAEPSVIDRYSVVAFDSPPAWCDEPRTRGLGERWEAATTELSDSIPDIVRCWRCGTAVGYVAADESDDLAEWRFAALVSGPGTDAVSIQCEECVPDALPTPWVDPPAPLPAVPDGEDVPARLDAAAAAVQVLGWGDYAEDLRNAAVEHRYAPPDVRAAAAAALARPTGDVR